MSGKSIESCYEPPEQSALGQIVDSALILLLVTASLFAPVYFGLAGNNKVTETFAGKDWAALGQSATAQAQWEKLGYTQDSARDIIASRFDYTVNWTLFLITAAIIVAYFVFVIIVSDRQYKAVIAERFAQKASRE